MDLTGGKVLQGSVGAEISFKSMSMGLKCSIAACAKFCTESNQRKGKGNDTCKLCRYKDIHMETITFK